MGQPETVLHHLIHIVPVLIFYAFFQRQILKGITFTGMGGM